MNEFKKHCPLMLSIGRDVLQDSCGVEIKIKENAIIPNKFQTALKLAEKTMQQYKNKKLEKVIPKEEYFDRLYDIFSGETIDSNWNHLKNMTFEKIYREGQESYTYTIIEEHDFQFELVNEMLNEFFNGELKPLAYYY